MKVFGSLTLAGGGVCVTYIALLCLLVLFSIFDTFLCVSIFYVNVVIGYLVVVFLLLFSPPFHLLVFLLLMLLLFLLLLLLFLFLFLVLSVSVDVIVKHIFVVSVLVRVTALTAILTASAVIVNVIIALLASVVVVLLVLDDILLPFYLLVFVL